VLARAVGDTHAQVIAAGVQTTRSLPSRSPRLARVCGTFRDANAHVCDDLVPELKRQHSGQHEEVRTVGGMNVQRRMPIRRKRHLDYSQVAFASSPRSRIRMGSSTPACWMIPEVRSDIALRAFLGSSL
jgi:hypothetical protein